MTLRCLLCALVLFVGWPATAQEKPNQYQKPAFSGAYEPVGVDERGLWMQLDEFERRFRETPGIVRDEAFNTYLRGVLCRTVGIDRCNAVRLYVVKERAFNASMTPNGLMAIHTGLLARVHSEAELATVLAHEFAHFELRHSLKRFQNLRRGTDVMSWLMLSSAATGQSTVATQNALVAGVYAFSRETETEADMLAAAYIRTSPYRLRASIVWKRLLDEHDALRAERELRRVRRHTPGVLDTHPTNLQRIAYFSMLEAEDGADRGEDAAEYYREQTKPFMPELFDSMVHSNEFAGVDFVIRSWGDVLGWDGLMLYFRAEHYRLRGNPRDIVTARQFFEKATTLSGAPPEAWRGLGLTAIRSGEGVAGQAALREYLAKRPDAPDAGSIKLLLE